MSAISLTINNHVIAYRELANGSEPRDGTVTIKQFLQYSKQLFCMSEADNICRKIKHYYDFRTDANTIDYDPTTPQNVQDKVWRTVQNLIPSLQEKNPEYIEVDNNFLDTVFIPLVPDSLFLKKVQSQDSRCFVKRISTICLIAEVVIREFVSGLLSLGLHIYSIYNPDYAAFFRLRLDMNRYRPYHELSNNFFAWIGGYGNANSSPIQQDPIVTFTYKSRPFKDKWYDTAQEIIKNEQCRQTWLAIAKIPAPISEDNRKERASALHAVARNLTGSFLEGEARLYILSAREIFPNAPYLSKANVESVLHCIANESELLAKFV